MLILVAYLSRRVEFVLNAAFSLRGLTSGALLGGLGLAVFWKKGRAASVITGMLVSLVTMTAIQLLPRLDWSKEFWMKTVGTEIFWPWYTLMGALITLGVAFGTSLLVRSRAGLRLVEQRAEDPARVP